MDRNCSYYNARTRTRYVERDDLYVEVQDYDRPWIFSVYSYDHVGELTQVPVDRGNLGDGDRLILQTRNGKQLEVRPEALSGANTAIAVSDLWLVS
ncbi:hypothetical protein [Leptolyngbya sp. FACHB-17]|uniref:hypothetical protein n=1 Tax=unclassified Leptolyngbya TaxID=2650499 RepID=UPI0016801D42|nr:hypothetical protein [Leptolyngbya sp. FACHB-17]MBD2079318.1 hypothetical protein [Leptolyngbya sp. FACHB-17]